MYIDVRVKHFGTWHPLGINEGGDVLAARSIDNTFLGHRKSVIIFIIFLTK